MKDYIKKLIVSIVFVVLLIILFLVVKGINENRQKDENKFEQSGEEIINFSNCIKEIKDNSDTYKCKYK